MDFYGIEIGYLEGERCNRNGCNGIIDEYESEYGCSCHLGNAPCGHCTTSREFCPECDWEGMEEQRFQILKPVSMEGIAETVGLWP